MKTSEKLRGTYQEESDFFYVLGGPDGEIHINHYYYNADCEIEEGKPYRCVSFSGCIIPFSELFAIPIEERNEYISNLQCDVKQYIEDLSEEEYLAALDRDEADFHPKQLSYSHITPDTHTGWYLS